MIFHYQTLVAGLIGFVGVILSLIANGYFARRQERERIAHNKLTILAALKAELRVNLGTFEARAIQLERPFNYEGDGYLPLVVFNDVYQQLLNQLGLLDEEHAESIIKVYLAIEELPPTMELLSELNIINDQFVQFRNPEQKAYAARKYKELASLIKEAIEQLS
ncbi:hypothetical protein JKP09_20815 [Vibrio vulnificus]|uniref:hypothetical protein n=1 Tax=Vibrio vulnificus TaxID=672 RepID=UPI001CDBF178|nr:hypothetical protein [Vibrio vulnificus]MCA3940729.1 hypothetical protein [Vibrio vulnificus]